MEETRMDKIWVIAESRNGRPLPAVLEVVAAARRFAPLVEAFSYDADAAQVATVLGGHGVATVFDLGELGGSLPGAKVAGAVAAAAAVKGAPDAVFVATTYDGRDVAARLSVKLDRPVITNVVELALVDGALVSGHAIFGGTEIARARFSGPGPALFVIRAKSFAPEPTGGAPAAVVALGTSDDGATDAARVVERHVEDREGPSLDDAAVVVSGGRGLGDKANYALIEKVAKLLHGAPGASRAIVDSGWVPYSYQVGQTGKTVKPDVYVACGISGATQHLVGMKGAKRIIAVNKDASAPIFSIADLGVVGDATSLLPRLIAALEARG